ncbi:MAG: hypothetical protein E7435_05840 [Ruminococcaceae bacterium]|nr:hypothetical protein [Oscillospiraceae bacterium]
MSIVMILKFFSDCCICFALLSSGPIQFEVSLLFPALICGASAGIATFFQEKSWRLLRILCAPMPLLCLFLANGTAQALLLAVPAIYTGAMILRGKLELEYYGYRQFFIRSLILLGIAYILINVLAFLSLVSGDAPLPVDGETILRYGFVHLICGIVLQRQLRLGLDDRASGNRRQMTSLLGVAGAIVVGFLVAEPMLRQQLLGVIRLLLFFFGVPIMAIIQLLSMFIEWIAQFRENQLAQGADPTGTMPSFTIPTRPVPNTTGVPGEEKPEQTPVDPILVWGLLVAVFLFIAAVFLYKSFQKKKAFGEVGKIRLSTVEPPKKKRMPILSNRYKVRQVWCEFLRVQNGWGLKLKKNDTSADVLCRLHSETDKESAAALRQFYLKARYDDRENVSREQVIAAKQALKGTKKGNTQ